MTIYSRIIEDPITESKRVGVEYIHGAFPNLKKELALPLLERIKTFTEEPYISIANRLRFTDNFSEIIDDWNKGIRTNYEGILIIERKDQNHIAVPIRDEKLSTLLKLKNSRWYPICYEDLIKYEDLDVSH